MFERYEYWAGCFIIAGIFPESIEIVLVGGGFIAIFIACIAIGRKKLRDKGKIK